MLSLIHSQKNVTVLSEEQGYWHVIIYPKDGDPIIALDLEIMHVRNNIAEKYLPEFENSIKTIKILNPIFSNIYLPSFSNFHELTKK
jgi:hypothetical protein